MNRALTRTTSGGLYHYLNGVRIEGAPSGLYGYMDDLRGYASDLRGDASDLSGNVTGLRGDVTGVRGDVDDCGLTAEDRARGVDVADLIAQPATTAGKE
jgi:hypothetical protein